MVCKKGKTVTWRLYYRPKRKRMIAILYVYKLAYLYGEFAQAGHAGTRSWTVGPAPAKGAVAVGGIAKSSTGPLARRDGCSALNLLHFIGS
jgi:hypothetical protein